MRPFPRVGARAVEWLERLEPRHLLAAGLLVDINMTSVGSWAREPVTLNGVGYFYANDGIHGRELWKTDGTPQGTSLAVDINPGPAASGGFDLHEAGGLLYFSAHDASGRVDMWRSDGTAAGTLRLTNVAQSNTQFLIENVASLNGAAVFGSYHHGLWRSDGTVAGTFRIAEVSARNVVPFGDALYFMGTPMPNGPAALWKTDGTAAGTMIVRQFSSPWASVLFEANGRLYFWADDSSINGGFEPWSSDGTAEGTVPLGNLVPGSDSSAQVGYASFNGAVYFLATEDPDSRRIYLYRTDGTPGSATLIADLGIYNSFGHEQPGLIIYDGALYFRGSQAGAGSELWRSDGTPMGTRQLIDLNPGSASSVPTALAVYDGRLYFKAYTDATGYEMFSTDGTAEGTRILREIAPGTRGIETSAAPSPMIFDGRLFFRADDGAHGMEMWSTDGTTLGTALFVDINRRTQSSDPGPLTAGPGGFQYFVANDGVRGSALWKTDGTAAGTSFVKAFRIIPPWYIGPFAHVNGLLLFGGYEHDGMTGEGTGFELWRSDGTEAGTYVVKDIAPGTSNGLGRPLITVGDRLFFRASTETGSSPRYGLWMSDGTHAGTRAVIPANAGFEFGHFSGGPLGDKLIFHANVVPGPEWNDGSIFITDGTPEGTHLVKDGFREPGAANWIEFNGHAYFTAEVLTSGVELWRSDGTEQGTVMLGEINPGSGSSSPANFVAAADDLYFTATDPTNGRELWRIGAQQDQPQRLTTLPSDVDQVQLAAAGRGVIFTTTAGDVYRFDGGNLVVLKAAGSFSAAPKLLGADRWVNYFSAGTSATGNELWKTDGTAAGTVLAQDLLPGSDGSWPQHFGVIGRKVLVSASIPEVGRELFVFPSFGALGEETPAPSVPPSRAALLPLGGGGGAPSSLPRIIDLLGDDREAAAPGSAGA